MTPLAHDAAGSALPAHHNSRRSASQFFITILDDLREVGPRGGFDGLLALLGGSGGETTNKHALIDSLRVAVAMQAPALTLVCPSKSPTLQTSKLPTRQPSNLLESQTFNPPNLEPTNPSNPQPSKPSNPQALNPQPQPLKHY